MTTTDAVSKRAHLDVLLRTGTVLIYVDGRACSGLPGKLRVAPGLVFRLGDGLTPPVVLEFGVTGFNATLAFDGESCVIGIPWSALYGMVSEGATRVYIQWPDSSSRAEAPVRVAAPIATPPRGKLRSV